MGQKKAPKPNAYSVFVQDLQKQHPQKYRKMQDAFEAAAPLWARMSLDQRKPYEERANKMKGTSGSQRFTSQGIDLQTLDAEEQLRIQMEATEREQIQQIMTSAYQRNSLATETFFIIHCNIFCHYPNLRRYYGAEIAVTCFNLKDGVKPENIFHFMVKPGPLPMGYKFDAQQHSDNTHQIPIPDDDVEEANTEEIYFKLKAFLEKKNPEGHKNRPILYASSKNVKVARGILEDWAACYDDDNQSFRVYELQKLFLELRNAVARQKVWSSMTFSDRELEKDVYDYTTEIACPYHANTPKPLFCSKSVVTRYVFIICDNCIGDLDIDYICGQHVPKQSTIPQDNGASWSARDSVAGTSTRGFDTDLDTYSMSDTWEKSSVRSTSTTTSHFDNEFPTLGERSRRTANTSEANASVSSRSYAGVTTINTPQTFLRDLSHLSLQGQNLNMGRGRGFRRRENDSDASSVNSGTSRSVISVGSDRSMLTGKGRGFRPKNIPRPGE